MRALLLALASLVVSARADAAGYVRSVEYVEIALSGTTAAANLTKGQVVANCVPFASAMSNAGTFRRVFTDIFLTAGAPPTVNVARDQTGGTTVTVGVYVVEFDPAYVKVQQGTFTIANGSAGPAGVALTTAVSSLGRAALVFYEQYGAGSTSFADVAIQGSFASTASVQFQRTGTSGAVTGHWFVFEALAVSGVYAFEVQPRTFTFAAASGTSAALSPSVPAATTFLTASYRTADATDQPDGAGHRIALSGCGGSPSVCTGITAQSYNGTSSVTVTAFAITFASGIRVQRGTVSYGAAATQATATLASPVNTGAAMAWNGFGSGPGVMRADVGTGGLPATGFQRVKLTNPLTVQADRGVTNDIAEGGFEVVEWQLSAAAQMVMRSGSYTGNGLDDRAIYVGFQPDVVIVDREDLTTPNPNDEAVIRTSTMLGDLSKNMDVNAGGTVLGANRVQSLDPQGFTVGTDNNVNQNAIVYHWIAFKAAPGQLKVGTYLGTGAAFNVTGVGFGPAYLLSVSAGAHNVTEKSVYCPRTSPRTSSPSGTRTRSWTSRRTASASAPMRSPTTTARPITTSPGPRSRGASPSAPTRAARPPTTATSREPASGPSGSWSAARTTRPAARAARPRASRRRPAWRPTGR